MTRASVIEAVIGARFHFATPYPAWERGTNENTNGLSCGSISPNASRLAHLTQWDLHRIARELNRWSRKRLGYRTPEECSEP